MEREIDKPGRFYVLSDLAEEHVPFPVLLPPQVKNLAGDGSQVLNLDYFTPPLMRLLDHLLREGTQYGLVCNHPELLRTAVRLRPLGLPRDVPLPQAQSLRTALPFQSRIEAEITLFEETLGAGQTPEKAPAAWRPFLLQYGYPAKRDLPPRYAEYIAFMRDQHPMEVQLYAFLMLLYRLLWAERRRLGPVKPPSFWGYIANLFSPNQTGRLHPQSVQSMRRGVLEAYWPQLLDLRERLPAFKASVLTDEDCALIGQILAARPKAAPELPESEASSRRIV